MNSAQIYLDHNATTPLRPEVLAVMQRYLTEDFGNASSLHAFGHAARAGLEDARVFLADALGCAPAEVHFTSGGTEADNWALVGSAAVRGPGRIVTTAIEHHAVLHTCRHLESLGCEVCLVRPDRRGWVDPGVLEARLDEHTILVSVMHANNETGVLQPVAEIGQLARRRGIPFHVDAVQSFGKVPVQVDQLGADLVSVSAHKLNGPKGVGALYVRAGTRLAPWTHGGGHEGGRRAGTENTAGIAGFGRAAQLAQTEQQGRQSVLEALRNRLEAGILAAVDGVQVNGQGAPRLPNTLNLSVAGVQSEALLLAFDLEGVAVSSGSACSAGGEAPSHVLLAMGLDRRLAGGSLRFSLGWGSTAAQVERVICLLPGLVRRFRDLAGGA
ncbi:MAG: cysteine desulfurase [Candidatus Latescibacteria bacterium]|nr:cysteine desulfurase [Candidatus Latescibacterota bacterium]